MILLMFYISLSYGKHIWMKTSFYTYRFTNVSLNGFVIDLKSTIVQDNGKSKLNSGMEKMKGVHTREERRTKHTIHEIKNEKERKERENEREYMNFKKRQRKGTRIQNEREYVHEFTIWERNSEERREGQVPVVSLMKEQGDRFVERGIVQQCTCTPGTQIVGLYQGPNGVSSYPVHHTDQIQNVNVTHVSLGTYASAAPTQIS